MRTENCVVFLGTGESEIKKSNINLSLSDI